MFSPILYEIAVDRNRDDQARAAQMRLLPPKRSVKSWLAAQWHLRKWALFEPNRLGQRKLIRFKPTAL